MKAKVSFNSPSFYLSGWKNDDYTEFFKQFICSWVPLRVCGRILFFKLSFLYPNKLLILTEISEKIYWNAIQLIYFFLSKKTDDLDRNLWKRKNKYLNEMQYIPSAPFFRHKDYQRIMWQNSNLISKTKENSLEELCSIIKRKKIKNYS